MWTLGALVLAGTLGAPPGATVSPAEVQAALEFGRSAAEEQLGQYELKTADTWLVNFDTPFLRIAQLAAAHRRERKALAEAGVPAVLAVDEIHVYVHARFQEAGALPNIEYVTILRPTAAGRNEVVLPRAVEHFVRQVPSDKGYYGPARIARSVRARFKPGALQAGGTVRVLFEGGALEHVPVGAELLARAR